MSRATWDETWLEVAHAVAKRSRCTRDQVGCVIVDERNRIVATGYNGPPAGYDQDLDLTSPMGSACRSFCSRAADGPTAETLQTYVDCVSLHAEANALLVCDRSAREGGTIYVSSPVCRLCAKLIANSGLARVVVTEDASRTYRSANVGFMFLEDCGLEVDVKEK